MAINSKNNDVDIDNRNQLEKFMDFVREQGVVGLAVGLAIGSQVTLTVKQIVDGLINPIITFIIGNKDELEEATWTVVETGDRKLEFAYGSVISSVITLIAVAAVIYFVVKGIGLSKLDKTKEE